MRKNIAKVIEAFKHREAANGDTCRTDGITLWSYNLPIAKWVEKAGGTHIDILDERQSPSRTTTSQIRAVASEFEHYNEVGSIT